MIRSYRSKRRIIQQEIKFLNSSKKISNQSSAIVYKSLNVLSTSEDSGIRGSANSEYNNNNCDDHNCKKKVKNNTFQKVSTLEQPRTDNFQNCTEPFKSVDDRETLKSLIGNWVIQYDVPHTTVNGILSILKQHTHVLIHYLRTVEHY